MVNPIFISVKFLVILILRSPSTYCVTVDDATLFPIRLNVIDGDGSPTLVDMYREKDHYLFIPVDSDGSHLPRNPNLEDPDPELGRILEKQYGAKERSRWVEPDENLEGGNNATGSGTNIDTLSDQVKSPSSSSHEQSFNQSPFKQTDPTFPRMKEWRNADSDDGSGSPHGPRNDEDSDVDGGLPFSSDEKNEFYFSPEQPNTISFLDKNERIDGNDRRANTNGGESQEHSSVRPISHRIMGRKMLKGTHQSDFELKPSRISMSYTTLSPLPNDLVTLQRHQNQDTTPQPASMTTQLTSKEGLISGYDAKMEKTVNNSGNVVSAKNGTSNHFSNSSSGVTISTRENSEDKISTAIPGDYKEISEPKNTIVNVIQSSKESPTWVKPRSKWVERDMSEFRFMHNPKYAKVINVKSGKKRVVVLMLSNNKESLEVTASKTSLAALKQKIKKYHRKKATSRSPPTSTTKITTTTTLPPYPEYPVENITCLTSSVIAARKIPLALIYHRKPGTCPPHYPCKGHNSCSLWETGLVDADLSLSQWIALSYLQDIFYGIHPKKLHTINTAFQDCLHAAGITIPFSKAFSMDCESRVHQITDCLFLAQNKGLCYNSDPSPINAV